VKRSTVAWADVPPAVVTVTLAVPVPGGEVTSISVLETTLSIFGCCRAEVDRDWRYQVRAGDRDIGPARGRPLCSATARRRPTGMKVGW
jgi:hypothetical protein